MTLRLTGKNVSMCIIKSSYMQGLKMNLVSYKLQNTQPLITV